MRAERDREKQRECAFAISEIVRKLVNTLSQLQRFRCRRQCTLYCSSTAVARSQRERERVGGMGMPLTAATGPKV